MTGNAFRARDTSGPTTTEVRPLSEDLLRGADEIAKFIYGTARRRRSVYHLAENHGLPVFRFGALICARRSTLEAWIIRQEKAADQGERER